MPVGLDSVLLTDSGTVQCGLEDMLTAAIGEHAYVLRHVDVPIALLVIEAAKRAEDRDDWFPRGKWATVQAMQQRVEPQLERMFASCKHEWKVTSQRLQGMSCKCDKCGATKEETWD